MGWAPPGQGLGVAQGMPDGAADVGRAVLEETAGRAAARVVRGRRSPASAGVRVLTPPPIRRVIAIATLSPPLTPLDVVSLPS